jgi:hypothetical protein
MKMVKNEEIEFPLGPSIVKLKVPEDCECERQDKDEVIITLVSLPKCKIHLDIVPYDPRFGQYYSKDFRKLLYDIRLKFGFDPNDKFKNEIFHQPQGHNNIGWYRYWWRDSEGIGIDIWLYELVGYGLMFRVMAGELKDEEIEEEESLQIKSIIESIDIEI